MHPRPQASSGLLADGRHISNRARDEAASYGDTYRSPISLKVSCNRLFYICGLVVNVLPQSLVDRVGLYVQAYTLYSSVRPFGCSTILGAVDKTGPILYVIEPSGVAYVSLSNSTAGSAHPIALLYRATTAPRLAKVVS